MRICLLCASARGLRFLDRLATLRPDAELLVFSFREEPGEPPFLDAIRERTAAAGGRFVEARRVGRADLGSLWEETSVDLLFAVGWRYLVPPAVYRRARLGAFVFHDSLLPLRRGHSPTVWAIVEGDARTGVSLLEMGEEADSGDLVAQREVPIGPDETIAEVRAAVTEVYLEVLAEQLPALERGAAPRTPQDAARATWCARRRREDDALDWRRSSRALHDLVRGTTRPYPGAYAMLDGVELRVWAARPGDEGCGDEVPGTILERGPRGARVRTGDGALWLTEVQLAGEPAQPAGDCARLAVGARLGGGGATCTTT